MQWIIYSVCLLVTILPGWATGEPARQGALGTWVWRSGPIEDEKKAQELVDFCHQQGFDTILLQMHYKPDSSPLELDNVDGLRRLLGMTAKAGIHVEALLGASNMALAEGRRDVIDHMDTILDFQANQPAGQGFSGIQYDIEPYTLPQWKQGGDQARTITKEMLEGFTMMRDHLRARFPQMLIKFDIPAWFDTRLDLAVDFGGKTKPLSEHIQDIADEVIIMTYRRTASGHNSVESLAGNEIAYAAKIGKKACVALETIPLKEDAQISFYGVPAAQFREVVLQLFADLGGHPGFGGVYLHQYDRLREYLPETQPLFPPAHE